MLKKLALGLGVVVAGLLIAIVTRPSEFAIKRSLAIAAPPEIVYAHVVDFHEWAAWSPWDGLDPSMKKTYTGGPGVGAKYEWNGNDKVGSGAMTIADAKPNEAVGITLEFKTPIEATNRTDITFAKSATGTDVTWSMSGKNNFMSKAFSLFVDMDKMVGADFDKGLGSLKGVSETHAKKAAEEKVAAEAAAAAAAAAATVDAGTP
ncbi:MAG: SRPBCC family protein [Archangium sp.]|nr:SRPBCC family protein [Archangium sp.]